MPIDLTHLKPAGAVAAGLALIPADRKTDGSVGSLPVEENVSLPVLDRYFNGAMLDRRRMRRDTGKLMDEFDVRPSDPSLPYGALSGGNQQKALLAKWFQTEPRLLLLDEPTQGVDVGARQQIYELIRTAAQERGMHVLCASSDDEQLAALCDRVIVFGRGRIWRELVGAEVTKDRIIEQASPRWRPRSREWSVSERPRRGAQALARCRPRRALRAARRVGLTVVVVFGIPRPDTFLTTSNFTTIFGSQAILVVLTLALLVAADRGRLRPLGRGHDGAPAMTLAILNVNHGWSIWHVDPRRARRRAHRRRDQRRARRAAQHRLADRRRSARRRSSRA